MCVCTVIPVSFIARSWPQKLRTVLAARRDLFRGDQRLGSKDHPRTWMNAPRSTPRSTPRAVPGRGLPAVCSDEQISLMCTTTGLNLHIDVARGLLEISLRLIECLYCVVWWVRVGVVVPTICLRCTCSARRQRASIVYYRCSVPPLECRCPYSTRTCCYIRLHIKPHSLMRMWEIEK